MRARTHSTDTREAGNFFADIGLVCEIVPYFGRQNKVKLKSRIHITNRTKQLEESVELRIQNVHLTFQLLWFTHLIYMCTPGMRI